MFADKLFSEHKGALIGLCRLFLLCRTKMQKKDPSVIPDEPHYG